MALFLVPMYWRLRQDFNIFGVIRLVEQRPIDTDARKNRRRGRRGGLGEMSLADDGAFGLCVGPTAHFGERSRNSQEKNHPQNVGVDALNGWAARRNWRRRRGTDDERALAYRQPARPKFRDAFLSFSNCRQRAQLVPPHLTKNRNRTFRCCYEGETADEPGERQERIQFFVEIRHPNKRNVPPKERQVLVQFGEVT